MTYSPHLVIADVETTGLGPEHCITEVSAYALHLPTRELVSWGELQIRLTPEQVSRMSPEAATLQGWTEERNRAGLPQKSALQEFHFWLSQYDVIGFVAHNAKFDRGCLEREGFVKPGLDWYCTRKGLEAYTTRTRKVLKNHKLASLAEASGYTNPDPHRSSADALTAAHGYLWLTANGVLPGQMKI